MEPNNMHASKSSRPRSPVFSAIRGVISRKRQFYLPDLTCLAVSSLYDVPFKGLSRNGGSAESWTSSAAASDVLMAGRLSSGKPEGQRVKMEFKIIRLSA